MDEPPVKVPLPTPRPLTDAEAAILAAVSAHAGSGELEAQCAVAEVVATCSCGCPSIDLRAAGPAVLDADVRRLAANDRDDYFQVTLWGTNAQGRTVEVTLHVADGRVHELEIWPGWDGGETTTDLPDPATLTADPL